MRHRAAVTPDAWVEPVREGLAVLRRHARSRNGGPGPLAPDALDEAAIVEDRLRALRGSAAALELSSGWRTAEALRRVGRAVGTVAVAVAARDDGGEPPPGA